MPLAALVVLRHGGERLGSVRHAHGHADDAARKHVPDADQNRVHDRSGIGGGEHRAVDLGGGGQGVELSAQLGGHGVEGRRQLLELIPAGDSHPAGEIPLGNATGSLLQLFERKDAAANLAHAQQQHHEARHSHDDQEGVGELHHRLQHFVLGFGEHHFPWLGRKGFGHAGSRRWPTDTIGGRKPGWASGIGWPPLAGTGSALAELKITWSASSEHGHPGGRGRHALIQRAPEILRTDLAHEGATHLVAADDTPQQVDPGWLAGRLLGYDQRQAQAKIRAVARGQPGAAGQASEDFDPFAIVADELDRDEPLPRQQVESGDQGLARGDQLGAGRRRSVREPACDRARCRPWPPVHPCFRSGSGYPTGAGCGARAGGPAVSAWRREAGVSPAAECSSGWRRAGASGRRWPALGPDWPAAAGAHSDGRAAA